VGFDVGVEPYTEQSYAGGCRSGDFHPGDFGSRKCRPEKCYLEKCRPLPRCQ
jgi:hypothetical protein